MSELEKLPPRKRKYVKGLADGKSKRQSALDAGYSETVANNAKSHIETEDVKAVFSALIRKAIPAEKIVQRLQEGLDAEKTEFAKEKGIITDRVNCVDFEQRRKYAELAAEFGRYHIPKMDVEHSGSLILQHSVPRPERG